MAGQSAHAASLSVCVLLGSVPSSLSAFVPGCISAPCLDKTGWPSFVTVVYSGQSANSSEFGPLRFEKPPVLPGSPARFLTEVNRGIAQRLVSSNFASLHFQERQDEPFGELGLEESQE